MAGKKKYITLRQKGAKQGHKFDFAHALRLLRLQVRKGSSRWLIDEENWKFENNEIIRHTNKANPQKTTEPTRSTGGEEVRE
jgi:hypothetical protein